MKIFRVYFYCILIAQFFLHPQWGLGFCWADSNCYYPTLWEVKATLSTFRSDFKFVTQFIWFSTPTGILSMTPTSGSWPRATCALFICNMLKGTFRLDELEYCSLKSAINLMTRWSLVTRQLFNNILTAQMTVSILTTNIGPVICMITHWYRWKKGYGRCWNGSWILAKLLVLYLFFDVFTLDSLTKSIGGPLRPLRSVLFSYPIV